jgi:hypothetical protein
MPLPEFFDPSLPANVALAFGCSGSGKTTFCFRCLVNAATPQPANPEPAACIFIYDWKREAELRLGVSAVTTLAGCEAALAHRLVVFNPHPMFPGDRLITPPEGGEKVLNDYRHGVRWFCEWAFAVCKRGSGRKIIYLDELREFQSKFRLPHEIGRIARMGRSVGLNLLTSTQFPRDYHADLRGSVTEWICFQCAEPAELAAVREYFPGADAAAKLAKGSFVAFNRDSGATRAGRLF